MPPLSKFRLWVLLLQEGVVFAPLTREDYPGSTANPPSFDNSEPMALTLQGALLLKCDEGLPGKGP